MNWLILTLFAITARSFFSLATKLLSSHVKVTPITQSILLTTIAGLLVFPVNQLIGGISFAGVSSVWLVALVAVVSQAFGNVVFFQGQKWLDAGTTQIAFSSILIWGTILSTLFLDSKYSGFQLLGIFFMLVSILLIQYRKGSLVLSKGILSIVASAGLFAIFQVASASISGVVSTGAYLILVYLGSSLILGVMFAKTIAKDLKLLKLQLKRTSTATLFASGTSFLYFLFSYFAFQQAPDRGIVVILLTAQVVVSVFLGIIFLKERNHLKRKIIAGAIAFVAAALIRS
jgi:drug/metabolite transporter (DMT)-like permease